MKIAYWLPVYIIALIIFYYSSLSSPLDGTGTGLSSWIFHVVEYFVLSVAAYFAFKNTEKLGNYRMNTILFVLLFAI